MKESVFDLFEILTEELSAIRSQVITRKSLITNQNHAMVLDDLKQDLGKASSDLAIVEAVKLLKRHFADRGSNLPFVYDSFSGRFTATDLKYLHFVEKMKAIRSVGALNGEFEVAVVKRLQLRVTGALHRVGVPRDVRKKQSEMNEYFKRIGFQGKPLQGRDQDGGLDILWVPLLGPSKYRPIVYIQCKNGLFDRDEANSSKEQGRRSIDEHRGLISDIHVPCVLFNDYLTEKDLGKKAMNYVPLDLTDLATPRAHLSTVTLC